MKSNRKEWHISNNVIQTDDLKSMIDKTIGDAVAQGLSYEEVYTMLHKLIDVSLYDFEIIHCL